MDKKEQLHFYSDLNEISFYFFFSIGLIHVISGLLTVNELMVKISWLINRLLDVPLFMVFILYSYSSLKLYHVKQGNTSMHTDLWFAVIGGSIALGLFIFDLTFSNNLPF